MTEQAVDRAMFRSLSPAALRELLPAFLSGFLSDPDARAANLQRVGAVVAEWSDETCTAVVEALATRGAGAGEANTLCAAIEPARALSRAWAEDAVQNPELSGVTHLSAAMAQGPTVILCNHLSYFDTSATDAVLAWAGHEDLANRLVAAAGPKVYQDMFRLVAASCLNTLPVPQSTSFAHAEKLSARELARKVVQSIESAGDLLRQGYVLLVYPEGSRSRTGQMGSFLRAIPRYLTSAQGVQVIPTAIWGTDAIMPVDGRHLLPGPVGLRFGAALPVDPDQPREVLVLAHAAIAQMLPDRHKPDPAVSAVL